MFMKQRPSSPGCCAEWPWVKKSTSPTGERWWHAWYPRSAAPPAKVLQCAKANLSCPPISTERSRMRCLTYSRARLSESAASREIPARHRHTPLEHHRGSPAECTSRGTPEIRGIPYSVVRQHVGNRGQVCS